MKIKSKSKQKSKLLQGVYTLELKLHELQYISALLYVTRLGYSKYQTAAYDLMGTIDDIIQDDEFSKISSNLVDFKVSIVDDNDKIIEIHHNSKICIEV